MTFDAGSETRSITTAEAVLVRLSAELHPDLPLPTSQKVPHGQVLPNQRSQNKSFRM